MHRVSAQIVRLPLEGVDPQVDRAIMLGELRDVQTVTLPGGTQHRVGRTKGVTYLSPSKVAQPNMKRRERRELGIAT